MDSEETLPYLVSTEDLTRGRPNLAGRGCGQEKKERIFESPDSLMGIDDIKRIGVEERESATPLHVDRRRFYHLHLYAIATGQPLS